METSKSGTSRAKPEDLPSSLPAVGANGLFLSGENIKIVKRESGRIRACQVNVQRMRPCRGGFSCGHLPVRLPNGDLRVQAGTFGGNARIGNNYGFILSNLHVLSDDIFNPTRGALILQQGALDGGRDPDDIIAELERWVPIEDSNVDCALARARDAGDLLREVEGIGTPTRMANCKHGDRVRKSGRTSGLTRGRILSTNAFARVEYRDGQFVSFDGQIATDCRILGGDSGSLLWSENELTVVGLVFANEMRGDEFIQGYANPILRVLEGISRQLSFFDNNGNEISFEACSVSLTNESS